MTVRVCVTRKKAVRDPQGKAVQRSLARLGFPQARDVRVGRFIEIALEAPSRPAAEKLVDDRCRKLLANTVIEEYRFEVTEG
jgi:phosphoribosylformylglycinamidine synthase